MLSLLLLVGTIVPLFRRMDILNGYTVVAKFRMVSQDEYSVW